MRRVLRATFGLEEPDVRELGGRRGLPPNRRRGRAGSPCRAEGVVQGGCSDGSSSCSATSPCCSSCSEPCSRSASASGSCTSTTGATAGWVDAALGLLLTTIVLGGIGGQRPKPSRKLASRLAAEHAPAIPELRALFDDGAARAVNYLSALLLIVIIVLIALKPGASRSSAAGRRPARPFACACAQHGFEIERPMAGHSSATRSTVRRSKSTKRSGAIEPGHNRVIEARFDKIRGDDPDRHEASKQRS
jgi:hypothetical protein